MGVKTKLAAAFLATSAIVGTVIGETSNAYHRGAAAADAFTVGNNTVNGLRGKETSTLEKVASGATSVLLGFAGGVSETIVDDNNQIELKTLPLILTNTLAGIAGGISSNFNPASNGTNAELAAELKEKLKTDPSYAMGTGYIHKFAMDKSYSYHKP